MGFQTVKDVTLIRHAYVLPNYQRKGVGSRLLGHLKLMTKTNDLLVFYSNLCTYHITVSSIL